MSSNVSMADSLLTTAIVLAVYLLPAIVGSARDHRDSKAIWAMNILLGWTLVGWAGALIWSLTGRMDKKRPRSSSTGAQVSKGGTRGRANTPPHP